MFMPARLAPAFLAIALVVGAVLPAGVLIPSPAQAQDMRAIDRRLLVAVTSMAFDEPAAVEALAAGADINARNPAMDDDSLLIAAIRQFKEPAVIAWLLDHGADPTATNRQGRNAASYFRQYHMDRSAEGRAALARLEGAAGGAARTQPGAGAQGQGQGAVAPARAPQARAVPSAAETRAATAAAAAASTAAIGGPVVPGVYECINQQAQISMMAFGIVDGSSYMTDGGRRGHYSYNGATGVLTLDPGTGQARYQRTGANLFRPLLPNGQLGGFTCPLNRAKNPSRPPW
jgi:hypothetical protein